MTSDLRRVTVIVPVAKDGPRPGGKPTWILSHPEGHPTLVEVLKDLDFTCVKEVIIVTTADHVMRFCNGTTDAVTSSTLKHLPALEGRFRFFQLTQPTHSAPETIAVVLQTLNITGPIFLKDGDGSFPHAVIAGDYVVGLQLKPGSKLRIEDIPSKSFIHQTNGILVGIEEKRVSSDLICVGGYAFEEAQEYLDAYKVARANAEKAARLSGEPYSLFNSHVVQTLLLTKEKVFTVKFTDSFVDWKTNTGWLAYLAAHRNLLIALEGVLFETTEQQQQGRQVPMTVRAETSFELPKSPENRASEFIPILQNIEYIRSVYVPNRTRVIITTQRHSSEREIVEAVLKEHNVPFDDILFNMMRCTTVMVASYGEALPHPSAVTYCVPENSAQLGSVLHLK
jgi:hypothetical protein